MATCPALRVTNLTLYFFFFFYLGEPFKKKKNVVDHVFSYVAIQILHS